MRYAVLGTVFALSVLAILSFGCGSNTPSSPNSFTNVYTKVIQPTCSSSFCHYDSVGILFSALDMSSKVRTYWSLVGQPCMGPNCGKNGMRVVPYDPDKSVLYQKLSALRLQCGTQMPANIEQTLIQGFSVYTGPELPADQQQLIHDWIQEGAQNN